MLLRLLGLEYVPEYVLLVRVVGGEDERRREKKLRLGESVEVDFRGGGEACAGVGSSLVRPKMPIVLGDTDFCDDEKWYEAGM